MVSSGGGHPDGFWRATAVRGTDPVRGRGHDGVRPAAPHLRRDPAPRAVVAGGGVHDVAQRPVYVAAAVLAVGEAGPLSPIRRARGRPPDGQQDGHADQERHQQDEERVGGQQRPPVLVQLPGRRPTGRAAAVPTTAPRPPPAAHTGPPAGRSAAQASHSRIGTAHTRWCSHVMGETTMPVVAHTRMPRNGDESRHAHRARAMPATSTTRAERVDERPSTRPGGPGGRAFPGCSG